MHNSKAFGEMVERARQCGCRIEDLGNKVKIFPIDKSKPFYLAHRSERAVHPARRYLKNVLGFTI